jgi:atypical dual specificity phosphatase
MPDMQPPTLSQAFEINQKIEQLLANNKIVAIHCRAGLGRTGTLLAAQLIYEGKSALSALEETRHIEMRWVQSEQQLSFLEEYETFIENKNTVSPMQATV